MTNLDDGFEKWLGGWLRGVWCLLKIPFFVAWVTSGEFGVEMYDGRGSF